MDDRSSSPPPSGAAYEETSPFQTQTADKRPPGDGITLVVARLRTRMEELLELAGVSGTIGAEPFYPSVHAAEDACVSAPRRPS